MFEEIPDDLPAEYLSGFAGFVASNGEQTEDMAKQDYAYVLNQIVGLERIENPNEDARASQTVVTADEAGDDALTPHEYTSNVFEREMKEWAKNAIQNL